MQTFGEFVREQRRLLGLTQRQIAQALGLRSIAYWSDVEANNRRPSRELLPTLARVLQVPLTSLEAHDTRAPLAQARALLQRHPEYAVAFCRVIEHSRELGFEEILRRIEQSPATAPETPLPAPATPVAPASPAVSSPKARQVKKPPQPEELFPDFAA
jgi:transcriptional regulator with XRE-family HTH domain